MQTIFNGSKKKHLIYNGKEYSSAIYNGKQFFEKETPIKNYCLIGDGFSWIDTEIPATGDITIKTSVSVPNPLAGGANAIYGGRATSTTSMRGMYFDPANIRGSFWYDTTAISAQPYTSFNPDIMNIIEDTPTEVKIDGKTRITRTQATFSSATTIQLFALKNGNAIHTPFMSKAVIEYWQAYDTSNNLIRDLIPVPKDDTQYSTTPAPSNCMWDTITKTYFENKGTGSFDIEEIL